MPPITPNIKNQPTIFTIFGATGDLSRKKIFPSFFELFKNNLLPEKFKILSTARSPFTTEQFISLIKENITGDNPQKWLEFIKLIEYVTSDIEKKIGLTDVLDKIKDFEKQINACPQRVYYMAISPFIYEYAFESLGEFGFNNGCSDHNKTARIVVEKPFGSNFESSQALNKKLDQYFEENQIYRIDHYLGKETVQNIFAFRFGNEIFEPVWSNKYIDNVQITMAEDFGVERRGEYYDKSGALRDVVQNHLLQLLAIVTMEEPSKFEQSSIRSKKLDILRSIRRFSEKEVLENTVRGQYKGYLGENKVDPKSHTETYALTKLFIDNDRWQNVPFYLRTGKKLTGTVTSIIFTFKERNRSLFENFHEQSIPNHITIQIQPNEGIGIHLIAKKPGLTTELQPVDMEFCYKTSFDTPQPDAYERLLMDIIIGDQTLFLGQVGESWKIIDPIRNAWDNVGPPLNTYEPGTWGPANADKIIKDDKREWLAPILSICKI